MLAFVMQVITVNLKVTSQTTTNDLVFYDFEGSAKDTVEAKENDTVVLSCSSKSSNTLELLCDRDIKHKTFKDTTSSVEITADRSFNGKECICLDLTYSTEKHIRLNITYHAEISDFYLMRGAAAVDNTPLSEKAILKLKCEATGNPPPLLQLVHRNESHVANVLNYTTGDSIEYRNKASCELAGQFTCVATNKINTVNSSREMILQVRCPPKSCESSKDLVYRVPLMKVSPIQICVLHYIQGLYSIQLYKLVNNNVNQVHYPMTFTYTTPTRLRGDFTLTLNLSTQNDYGDYFLRIDDKQLIAYRLYFSLQQQERSQCPMNLSITPDDKNFLLSWMAGDDGGSKQTFVVLKATSNKEFTEVGQINHTLGNTTFKVAGLEPSTTYILSVNVYNDIGTTNCSHQTVSGHTPAFVADRRDADFSSTTIIIIVAGCVIVIVAGVVICFLVRTKCKYRSSSEAVCLGCQHTSEPKTTEETELTDQLHILTLPTDNDGYLMASEARQDLVSQTQSGLVPQLEARDNTTAELHRRQLGQIAIQAPTNQASENHYDLIEDERQNVVNNSNFRGANHQQLHQDTSTAHVLPKQNSDTTNVGDLSSGNVNTIYDYTSLYDIPENNTYNNGEHQYAVPKYT